MGSRDWAGRPLNDFEKYGETGGFGQEGMGKNRPARDRCWESIPTQEHTRPAATH